MQASRLPLAVSCGDPSGIGPDIILTSWLERKARGLQAFYVLGDPDQLRARANHLGINVPIAQVQAEEAVTSFENALPVCPLFENLTEKPGIPDVANAKGIIESIDRAVDHVTNEKAGALITAPIAKSVLYEAGFGHPGHTEYLAELAHKHFGYTPTPVMMIAGPALRTIPVTIHIPLADVASALTTEAIVETGQIAARDLIAKFGISKPRLAISGLNPHAGENGTIGREDDQIIRPAIEALVTEGIDAVGPLPADTMFHSEARQRYDVAICMYHDQALVPAKALGFDDSVNVTLGLPFIRTSPDHGTAFAIAGTGKAKPDSFAAAVRMASDMAEATANG